jgi:hypothetical protein
MDALKYSTVFSLKYGALFTSVMILAVILSNPLLLVPAVASQYLADAKESITWGRQLYAFFTVAHGGVTKAPNPVDWYEMSLRDGCGYWWTYLWISVICLFSIICDRQRRLQNVIVASWVLPSAAYLLFFGPPTGSHYFLSVALPMASCIGNPAIWQWRMHSGRRRTVACFLLCGTIVVSGIEFLHFFRLDIASYGTFLDREEDAAVAFGRELDELRLCRVPHDRSWRILRHWGIYVPHVEEFAVEPFEDYYFASYEDVSRSKPDIIVMKKRLVDLGSDPKVLSLYAGKPEYEQRYRSFVFFRDVKENRVKGYRKILERDVAVAFEKERGE